MATINMRINLLNGELLEGVDKPKNIVSRKRSGQWRNQIQDKPCAFRTLSHAILFWSRSEKSLHIKYRIYLAFVRSILLYDREPTVHVNESIRCTLHVRRKGRY